MKFLAIFILSASLHVSAKTYSQKVTIVGKNLSLQSVFTSIERQTDFEVVYSNTVLAGSHFVDLDIKNEDLQVALSKVLVGQKLVYTIKDRFIVISVEPSTGGLNPGFLPPPPITVRGHILNENGEPVIASITIKGTNRGTTSDENGYFQLENVNYDAVLIITASNIETITISVNGKKDLNISVRMNSSSLNEVVINKGYYSEKQKLSTGNITKVTSKEISGQPITSPLLSLQGRVAGLHISPANGAPGAAPRVRVRGENSLRPNGGYPLYVVDGVMIDPNPLKSAGPLYNTGGMDPLANINPENIETIEVLKDADATAIYGSRGANGVILVTTKRAAKIDGIDIGLNVYRGVGVIPKKVDLLNTSQYLEMRKEGFINSGTSPSVFDFDLTQWDSTRYTDWQKTLIGGTADIEDIQMTFSGGNSVTSFLLGGGYHKETTVASDDFDFTRTNFSLRLSHRPNNGKLSINVSLNYGVNSGRLMDLSMFMHNALTLPPNAPSLYQEDGSLNWGIVDFGAFKITSFYNPMGQLLKTHDSKTSTLVGNGIISYELIKGLSATMNLGYTVTENDEIIKTPIASYSPADIFVGLTGMASFGRNKRTSWIIEPQLQYLKPFENSRLEILLGTTFQKNFSQWQSVSAYGYGSDALLNSISGANFYYYDANEDAQYRYMALFGRVGYTLKDRYIVNLTGRRDGSSRFGSGNKFGNFGAVGLAWIFSAENALREQSSWLNFGKIRMSYGLTGNDQIGDYQYYDLYRIGDYKYQDQTTLTPRALLNENFQWEVTKKLEAAIETSFLDSRLSFSVAWYRNRSSNQLVDYPLPITTGFSTIISNFPATVENRGWEFVLETKNVRTHNFNWTSSFNFTIPKNELVSFDGIEDSPYKEIYQVGQPLSVRSLYVWSGVDPETGEHKMVDFNEDGQFDFRDRRFGNATAPEFYGGVMNSMRFKSWELSFLIQYTKQLGSGFYLDYPGSGRNNQFTEVLSRWRKEGDQTNVAKFSRDPVFSANFNNVLTSDYFVADASFIKLRTLSLAYNFSGRLIDPLKIKSAKIYLQGQNLLTISDFVGYDPETGARGVPQLRMFTVGFQLKF